MILAGLGLLWAFASWQERQARLGRDGLLDVTFSRSRPCGLASRHWGCSSSCCWARSSCCRSISRSCSGWMPSRRQATHTDVVMMLIAALLGPARPPGGRPRGSRKWGRGVGHRCGGAARDIDVTLNELGFALGLAIFGVGAGLLASQPATSSCRRSIRPGRNEAGGSRAQRRTSVLRWHRADRRGAAGRLDEWLRDACRGGPVDPVEVAEDDHRVSGSKRAAGGFVEQRTST